MNAGVRWIVGLMLLFASVGAVMYAFSTDGTGIVVKVVACVAALLSILTVISVKLSTKVPLTAGGYAVVRFDASSFLFAPIAVAMLAYVLFSVMLK